MKRHGFTLLEMMVAVAVIGILASLSMYGLSRMTLNARRSGAIREVFMLVQEARSEARGRNQPVRLEVTPGQNGASDVRWGRLPCGDVWGRNCPSTACINASACGTGGCTCDRRSTQVSVPAGVTMTNVAGLCFLGSSSQPREAKCEPSGVARTLLRFDIESLTTPYLIVLEPLSGTPRLIDCGRAPKDPSCP
ncbi:MAG: pilus assembly FimT family protein [Archangium sp.]